MIIGCILGALGIAFVLEYIVKRVGVEIYGLCGTTGLEIVLVILGVLISRKEVKCVADYDEPFIEGFFNTLKEIWKTFTKNSIVHICSVFLLAIMGGCFLAKIDAFAHATAFVNGVYLAIKEEQTEDKVLVLDSTVTQVAEDYLTSGDPQKVKVLKDIYIPNRELECERNLSIEDYERIFFTEGTYKIIDWENQEHVNQVILQMVEELCEEKAENIFDKPEEQGGAPVEMANRISQASEKETTVTRYDELSEILEVRTDAYGLYPKKSIANLISNNYHDLAMAFALQGGNENTIVYFYGQSIKSNFECLRYADNSNESIKDRLTRIAQRYTDIAFVCPEYAASENAKRLAEAFKNAADRY